MGQPDLSEKDLLRKNDVFADIVNTLLGHGRELVKAENLISAETESIHFNDASDELENLFRDSCKKDTKNGRIYAIYGVESQEQKDYTMPLRCMGYDYGSYKNQVEELLDKRKPETRKSASFRKDDRIAPVITLVLYYGSDWEEPRAVLDLVDIPEELGQLGIEIPDYKMNLIQLGELDERKLKEFQSDFQLLAAYVRYQKEPDKLRGFVKNYNHKLKHPKETQLALAAVTKDKRYLELKRRENDDENEEKEESEVCEVYDMLVKEGMEMAMEQAMEKADEKVQAAEKKVQAAEQEVLDTKKASITNMVTLMKGFHMEDFEIVKKIQSFYPMSNHEAWNYVRPES